MTSLSSSPASASTLYPAKRSLPFLIVMGLFGLGLGFTLNILDPFIYTEKVRLLAPPFLKNTVLGFITIMSLIVALVVQPVVGWWSDRTRCRWGKRGPYLTGGTIGLSLSLFFIVMVNDLWLLVMAAMLISASSNTTQGAWQALIPDRVPVSQHGTAAGIKTLLELIGVISGVGLVGVTLARGNLWGAPLAAVSLFLAILLVTLYTLWRTSQSENLRICEWANGRTHRASVGEWANQQKDEALNDGAPFANSSFADLPFANLLTRWVRQVSPSFPWWMFNRFLFWSAGIAIRTFMLNYMEDVLSLPLAEAQALSSRLFLVLGLGVFLLALPAGVVADRIGRRPLLIAAGLMAASGTVLLVFLRDLNLLFIGGGLIALGVGIFASASWALATDLVPGSEGAQYLALANVATVLGSIGGRLGGPLIDTVNYFTGTVTVGYLVVFGIASLFFIGSSGVVLKIPEKLPVSRK